MKNADTKYWLVGAAYKGIDHQDEAFVNQGIWMLGWKKGSQYAKASCISVGDRIAIKRRLGRAQTGIRIMHIGIVRGVIAGTDKVHCTVNWAATNLDRIVRKSKGCFKSVHGPYSKSDPDMKQWIEEIFSL